MHTKHTATTCHFCSPLQKRTDALVDFKKLQRWLAEMMSLLPGKALNVVSGSVAFAASGAWTPNVSERPLFIQPVVQGEHTQDRRVSRTAVMGPLIQDVLGIWPCGMTRQF